MFWAEGVVCVLGEDRGIERRLLTGSLGGWLVTEVCDPDEGEKVASVIFLLN